MEDLITTSPELSEFGKKLSEALNQMIKKFVEAMHILAKAFQEFVRRVSKSIYITMCGSPRVYFWYTTQRKLVFARKIKSV